MFQRISIKGDALVRVNVNARCRCGTEYMMAQQDKGLCPACGRRIIVAMATEGGPWKPAREWKVEALREMLANEAWNQVPAEHRKAMRQHIETQIRESEDGSWRARTMKQIEIYRMMLTPGAMEQMPEEERDKTRQTIEDLVLELEAELES